MTLILIAPVKRWLTGIIILIVMCFSVDTGQGTEQWATTLVGSNSESVRIIQPSADGGYILAGCTSSFGQGENDLWVVKLDSRGKISWQKTYGGSGNDYATALERTPDGQFIVAGTTYSFGAGKSDAWLLKLDQNGQVCWQKTYGGSSNDYAASLQVAPDGFIVVGSTFSFGAQSSDVWAFMLDNNGNIIWQKSYGAEAFDWAFCCAATGQGNYLIAAETFSFGQGKNDIWLLKLDGHGDLIWQKTYGASVSDWPFRVQPAQDGGFILVGNTSSSGEGQNDIWIMKLSNDGEILWQKRYGGRGFDWPSSIRAVAGGGYVISGGTHSFGLGQDDLWILTLDEKGNVNWQKTYGGIRSDYANSVCTAGDGFIVAGVTCSGASATQDVLVLKLDSQGRIPGCMPMRSSNAFVSDTTAVVAETTCRVRDTSAETTVTNVTAQDSDVQTSDEFCRICKADLTGDNTVNMSDFSLLAKHWLQSEYGEPNGWCTGADINQSGSVDSADLSLFCNHWVAEVQ